MRIYRRRLVSVTGALLFLMFPLLSPLFASSGEAEGGGDPSSGAGGQFIIRLKPSRPQGSATEQDKAKIIQHFEYLQRLLSEGKLILAGMALDDYEAVVIIRAGDRLEAERILAADPAVGANVFVAELHPFRVTFLAAEK